MEGSTHGRLPGLLYLLVTVSTPLVSDSPDIEILDREKWIPRTVDWEKHLNEKNEKRDVCFLS